MQYSKSSWTIHSPFDTEMLSYSFTFFIFGLNMPWSFPAGPVKANVLPVWCVSAEPYVFSFVFLLWDNEKHQRQRHRWQILGSLATFITLKREKMPYYSLETRGFHSFILISPQYIPALALGGHWPLTLNPPLSPTAPTNLNIAAICCCGITASVRDSAYTRSFIDRQAGNHWCEHMRLSCLITRPVTELR